VAEQEHFLEEEHVPDERRRVARGTVEHVQKEHVQKEHVQKEM
jgi:hypothetical protein